MFVLAWCLFFDSVISRGLAIRSLCGAVGGTKDVVDLFRRPKTVDHNDADDGAV